MLILGFALLIILFGMSLILPVMLVRKWQAHPVLALLGVIAFILGLPILIIFQWRNRRKQKGLTQKTIEETF